MGRNCFLWVLFSILLIRKTLADDGDVVKVLEVYGNGIDMDGLEFNYEQTQKIYLKMDVEAMNFRIGSSGHG